MVVAFSLKTKMSITVSLLVVVLMAGSAFLIISRFHERFKANVAAQQYALLTEMTQDIDDFINDTRQVIVLAANAFPRFAIENPALAQTELAESAALHTLFDNGIFLVSPTGKVLAEYPAPGQGGTDILQREYFQKTVDTAKPHVSEPYISSQPHHHPAVVFSAPILDSGKVVAVLAGSIDLTKDNFLGEHARVRIGNTGYTYVFSTDRTIIMHPDLRRILKRDEPPGVNRAFDEAIAGFDGTEETVNAGGLRTLTSVRHLKSINWILAANYPLREAYAPIREATRYSIIAVVAGGILSVLVVWLTMRVFTAPLLALTRHISGLQESGAEERVIRIRTRDEIEELANAFNAMIRRLDRKQEELRKLSRAVEQSASLVMITDMDGAITYVNPKFCDLTGYGFAEVIGENPRILKSGELPAEAYRQLWETITAGYEWQGEFHDRKKNGELFWTVASISPIKNDRGEITHFISVQEDITDRKRTETQLRHLSTHDTLTGLYNRAFFAEEMERLARSRLFPISVIMADVDGLKPVNDSRGHEAGDRLLQAAAGIFLSAFRAEDAVARIGGDEFAVLLPETDAPAAMEAVARIRKCLDDANAAGGEFTVSISLGTATADREEELRSALQESDALMYLEKFARKSAATAKALPEGDARPQADEGA